MSIELPAVSPLAGFSHASETILEYLKTVIPLGYWSVTRYDGACQVHLLVRGGEDFGLRPGQAVPWEHTLCQHSVAGAGPQVAPDVTAVPVYAESAAVRGRSIGAYVGMPITLVDGSVFGTICGLDRAPWAELVEHEPLLQLLSTLLAAVLEGDLDRVDAARRLEGAELLAETDPLTGLCNRRAWDLFIDREEDRHRRSASRRRWS